MMPFRTVRNRLTGINNSNPNAVSRLFIKAYDGENLDYVGPNW